jgi:hypothetical protein
MLAGWVWGALTLYAGVQAVRVAACIAFLVSLMLQISIWFRFL